MKYESTEYEESYQKMSPKSCSRLNLMENNIL
jgi:hypothetical protein